jgi:hypothetical protein
VRRGVIKEGCEGTRCSWDVDGCDETQNGAKMRETGSGKDRGAAALGTATLGEQDGGHLLGQIRDGITELSTAGIEVGAGKALGDEDVARNVLSLRPRWGWGGRRSRSLGLRTAQSISV